MILEGDLVRLVPYGPRFRSHEHTWHNGDAWFWATMGERIPLAQAFFRRRHEQQDESREQGRSQSIRFGIETQAGMPIGDIAISWLVPHHRLAMLSAVIGEPEYWSGGYGTDALLLIVDYAFNWLDLHRIWLSTMSLNARVMRQMEKAGFTLEAHCRQAAWADYSQADLLIYGLLREEWPGRVTMLERLNRYPPKGNA